MNNLGLIIFIYFILAYVINKYFTASEIYKSFIVGYEEGYNSKNYDPDEAFKKYILPK
jgi:hypothetical protein